MTEGIRPTGERVQEVTEACEPKRHRSEKCWLQRQIHTTVCNCVRTTKAIDQEEYPVQVQRRTETAAPNSSCAATKAMCTGAFRLLRGHAAKQLTGNSDSILLTNGAETIRDRKAVNDCFKKHFEGLLNHNFVLDLDICYFGLHLLLVPLKPKFEDTVSYLN
ncbi:UPF0538 protein C2orf76 homolog isoform X1 [Mobula birostris]|uniref:UPF0538 protein C2orf76 homolog isoform X1 n=1 Tax=Mobula birostris TaxID=1983395 RepID=UPI003B284C8F